MYVGQLARTQTFVRWIHLYIVPNIRKKYYQYFENDLISTNKLIEIWNIKYRDKIFALNV